MLPKYHILFGFIFSLLAWLIFPSISFLGFLIIFLSSVLIDVDHYLVYVYKKKDLSLNRAYSWFISQNKIWRKMPKEKRVSYKQHIMAFHGIEFLVLLILASLFNNLFSLILIGVIFHILLDIIDSYSKKQPISMKLSQFHVAIKNKKRKKFEQK